MINWEKPHTEAFIEKHIAEVDWSSISCYQKLSESFIERHADKVNWCNISCFQKLSEAFIEKYADEVNWWNISRCQKLSEKFIEKHADKVNWPNISYYQKLSERFRECYAASLKAGRYIKQTDLERRNNMINWTKPHTEAFIEKHIKSVEWGLIVEFQKLSERFIDKYASKLGWWYIAKYQDISAEYALRHKNKLKKAGVGVEDSATYVRLYPYRDGCGIREIPKKLQYVQVTKDAQVYKDPPSTSKTDMDYIKDHAAELYNKYVTSSDTVNNPAHYQTHELECLVEMSYIFGEEALLHFAQCCAWKYRYRAGSKDSAEEDLKKSDFYTALARWLRQGV